MRIFNRLALVLVALILIAGGLLAIVEGALVAADRPPFLVPLERWYDALTTTRVSDQIILTLAILVTLLGLIVLLTQLRSWPPERLSTASEGWHVQRRSVEHQISTAVTGMPGIGETKTRAGKHWRLRVQASADRSRRAEVEQVVRRELTLLEAPDSAEVDIRLSKPRVA